MFVPFIVIIPGMIAARDRAASMAAVQGRRRAASVDYNDAMLLLMRDLLPNGMLGLAITGLLASFMAGMAANLSSFNTVFTYDIWQRYVSRTGRTTTTCGSAAG